MSEARVEITLTLDGDDDTRLALDVAAADLTRVLNEMKEDGNVRAFELKVVQW